MEETLMVEAVVGCGCGVWFFFMPNPVVGFITLYCMHSVMMVLVLDYHITVSYQFPYV